MSKVKVIKDPHCSLPIRVYFRKRIQKSPRRSVSPRILVRCGCCKERLEIYHNTDESLPAQYALEIGGVSATVRQWREVLFPLLGVTLPVDFDEPAAEVVGTV